MYERQANKGKQKSVIFSVITGFIDPSVEKTTSQYYGHDYIPTVQQRNFIKGIPQVCDRAAANLPYITLIL